jgi:hypothetical protein
MSIKIGNTNADTSVKLGNTTIQSGYIGTNIVFGNQIIKILDIYPTSIHHAYSLRKLKTAYTGFCLRIRRTTTTPSVTTTTVDLSFDSNDTISLNSAITYVSGTATTATNLGQFCASILNGYSNPDLVNINQNIFVVTWFDQSGNGKNPTQATAGNQPRLVNAGNLETKDSKVAVRFVKASATNLTVVDTTSSTNNLSVYFVGAYVTTVTANIGYATGANRIYFPYSNGVNLYAGYTSLVTAILLDSLNTNRKLYEFLAPTVGSTTLAQSWSNGVAKTTTPLQTFTNINIQLGTGVANYFDGYIQEVLGYQTNADRLNKENNINSYWQIY